MEERLDLYRASRDDLVRLVVAQRDQIRDLERRLAWQAEDVATLREQVAALTTRVGELLAAAEAVSADGDEGDGTGGVPRGMPGLKPATPARTPATRRRRGRGYGRVRLVPTARQVHALADCPRCCRPLTGGTAARTREVIEVPLGPPVVTEHVYLERRCPQCGGGWSPGPELDGLVVGQGRLGIGVLSLIAWLREEGRVPVAVIQRYLAQVHGLALSVGAIVGATQTVATRAERVVTGYRDAIRGSPVVHADETGWREGGTNGYTWTFSTPQVRYFVRGGRDASMLADALGTGFAGVLVSDFYGVYTAAEGIRHQYCWAHLLRDVDEVAQRHKQDAAGRGWADGIHRLFGRAQDTARLTDPPARQRARQELERALLTLCAPYLRPKPTPVANDADDEAPAAAPADPAPAVLCRRIDRHLGELFVFVEEPAVPATNNAAERALRPLVTSRKISGGTRSEAGTDAKMTLASLFGTWRLQGRNPLDECRRLLASPQP
jgi:transposase